jgi:hypothetical protein
LTKDAGRNFYSHGYYGWAEMDSSLSIDTDGAWMTEFFPDLRCWSSSPSQLLANDDEDDEHGNFWPGDFRDVSDFCLFIAALARAIHSLHNGAREYGDLC